VIKYTLKIRKQYNIDKEKENRVGSKQKYNQLRKVEIYRCTSVMLPRNDREQAEKVLPISFPQKISHVQEILKTPKKEKKQN
jgi:hypothetical protein